MKRCFAPGILVWALCLGGACSDEIGVYNPGDGGGGDAADLDTGARPLDGDAQGGAADAPAGEGLPGKDARGVDGPCPDALTSCTPGSFVACDPASVLQLCDALGTGTIAIDCAPYLCDAVAKRCSQCDPAAPPTCSKDVLVVCSAEGLQVRTVCPYGCKAGKCLTCTSQLYYRDGDKDGYGNPAAPFSACAQPTGYVADDTDCDDLDPSAHPGQANYFATPTKGTLDYDYNCDKAQEPQFGPFSACTLQGGSCQGTGWLAPVPACGQSGQKVNCTKRSGRNPGCDQNVAKGIQACR